MDLQVNIKKLNATATKYIVHHNDETTLDLQRKLDVFILYAKVPQNLAELELSGTFLTECVPKVVDILQQVDTTSDTARKILCLLQNLMFSHVLKHELKSTGQLTAMVSSFLCTGNAEFLKQCLDILQQLTYEIVITHRDPYLEELIIFLINHIQVVPIDELVQPCLTIVTNLCRKNSVVQKLIRNKADIKLFYRRLLAMIDAGEKSMLRITALSTLTALLMNDDLGSKLFSANNLSITLELVQNTIMEKNEIIQTYALDLFMDFMMVERIQQHCLRTRHIESMVTRLLHLLIETKEIVQISKIFEMHLSLCSVDTLRRAIMPVILKWNGSDNDENRLDVLTVVTKWIGQARPEGQWDCQIHALRYLLQLLKDTSFLQGATVEQVETLVWTISKNFSVPWLASPFYAAKMCERMVEEIAVLIKLCENKNHAKTIGDTIGTETCTKLIDTLMNYKESDNMINMKRRSGLIHITMDSPKVTYVIVSALSLMVKIRSSSNGIEGQLYRYLQDPLFMRVIADSLMSESEDCVQKALALISLGSKLPEFPQKRLSICIVSTNANLRAQQRNSEQFLAEPLISARVSIESEVSAGTRHSMPSESAPTVEKEAAIDDLIEKVDKGLQISDIKQSQIMEIYERKLQSLEVKQKYMQDLLDSKTRVLQQADTLMAQYRCRWAQSDAEALQLRNLLCESEKRSESAKEETTRSLLATQDVLKTLESLKEDNSLLSKTVDDHIKKICEQKNRITALEESNRCFKNDQISLIERNDSLQSSNDNYRQKQEKMTASIGNLELKCKDLAKQVEDRDSMVAAFTKSQKSLEKIAKSSSKELNDLKEQQAVLEKKIYSLKCEKEQQKSENVLLESRCQELVAKMANLQVDRDKYFLYAQNIISMSSSVMP